MWPEYNLCSAMSCNGHVDAATMNANAAQNEMTWRRLTTSVPGSTTFGPITRATYRPPAAIAKTSPQTSQWAVKVGNPLANMSVVIVGHERTDQHQPCCPSNQIRKVESIAIYTSTASTKPM